MSPVWFAVALLLGVLSCYQLSALPAPWIGLLPLLALVFWLRPAMRVIAVYALGFVLAWANAYWAAGAPLSPDLYKKDVWVVASVIGLPEAKPRITRYDLQIHHARDADDQVIQLPKYVRVNGYQSTPLLKSGETWRLQLRLSPIRGFRNGVGFDYERWAFSQYLGARGYIRTANHQRLKPASRWSVDALRARVSQAMQEQNQLASGLLPALAVGDRRYINDHRWQQLIATGTNHLVAISGLHIGLMAGWVFFLVQWLWRRSARLCLWMPAIQAAALLGLIAGLAYAALAGFALPTQRAFIMLSIVMMALWFRLPLQPMRVLSLAFIAVILFDPRAVLSASFWLSFAAVGWIVYSAHWVTGSARWQQWLWIQFALLLGLAPFTLMFFSTVSWLSPLANWVAVPLMSFWVVPLTLLGLLMLPLSSTVAGWLWSLASEGVSAFLGYLDWLQQIDTGLWQTGDQGVVVSALLVVAAIVLIMPRGLPYRWLALWLCLPMFFSSASDIEEGTFRFTLLDVGQGQSVYVATAEHHLLMDTGARFISGFSLANAVVTPYLRQQAVAKLDRVILSHGDNDHAGGAEDIKRDWPVDSWLGGTPDTLTVDTRRCVQGDSWVWDGVTFDILWPPEHYSDSENNRSCVLKISDQYMSVLIPSDIERSAESVLAEQFTEAVQADALVLSHHGSKSSSSTQFLDAVNPSLALVSSGYLNRYGFPNKRVVNRLQERGIPLYQTQLNGAISIRSNPRDDRLYFINDDNYRSFWYH